MLSGETFINMNQCDKVSLNHPDKNFYHLLNLKSIVQLFLIWITHYMFCFTYIKRNFLRIKAI